MTNNLFSNNKRNDKLQISRKTNANQPKRTRSVDLLSDQNNVQATRKKAMDFDNNLNIGSNSNGIQATRHKNQSTQGKIGLFEGNKRISKNIGDSKGLQTDILNQNNKKYSAYDSEFTRGKKELDFLTKKQK